VVDGRQPRAKATSDTPRNEPLRSRTRP
jgi:hypothetical protein